MSRFLKSLGLVVVVLVLSGCSRPIYHVDEKTFVQIDNQGFSKKQVRNTIIETATNSGWDIAKEKPGVIYAKRKWNQHMAQVKIDYSNKKYSIQYDDSNNLGYKPSVNKNGEKIMRIHRRYNGFVRILERDIDNALSGASIK